MWRTEAVSLVADGIYIFFEGFESHRTLLVIAVQKFCIAVFAYVVQTPNVLITFKNFIVVLTEHATHSYMYILVLMIFT